MNQLIFVKYIENATSVVMIGLNYESGSELHCSFKTKAVLGTPRNTHQIPREHLFLPVRKLWVLGLNFGCYFGCLNPFIALGVPSKSPFKTIETLLLTTR